MAIQEVRRFISAKLSILLVVFICQLSYAEPQNRYPLATPIQQETFQKLLENTRCLVCQNQNLADSQAPLANDLRDKIYQRVKAGESEQQVLQYLVKRYGDFVLYQPPLQANTYILWLGPIVFLLIGLITVLFLVRRREAV